MDFYDGSWDEEVTVRDESGAAITIPSSTNAYDVWSGCEDGGTERFDVGVSTSLGSTTKVATGRLNGISVVGPLKHGFDTKATF